MTCRSHLAFSTLVGLSPKSHPPTHTKSSSAKTDFRARLLQRFISCHGHPQRPLYISPSLYPLNPQHISPTAKPCYFSHSHVHLPRSAFFPIRTLKPFATQRRGQLADRIRCTEGQAAADPHRGRSGGATHWVTTAAPRQADLGAEIREDEDQLVAPEPHRHLHGRTPPREYHGTGT